MSSCQICGSLNELLTVCSTCGCFVCDSCLEVNVHTEDLVCPYCNNIHCVECECQEGKSRQKKEKICEDCIEFYKSEGRELPSYYEFELENSTICGGKCSTCKNKGE